MNNGRTEHRLSTQPRNKRRGVPDGTHPALAQLLEAIIASDLSWDEIGADADLSRDTARHWFLYRGRDPGFRAVCAVAAAIGLEVKFVPAPRRIAADGYALMDDPR